MPARSRSPPITVAIIPFFVRELLLDPVTIGALVGVGAVAALAGSVLDARLNRQLETMRALWLPLALTAPWAFLVPIAPAGMLGIVIMAVSILISEAGQIVYAIGSLSARQRLVPRAQLGRVTASMRFVIMGLYPLGALAGGIIGELLGLRATLLLAALLGVLAVLPLMVALIGRGELSLA